MRSAVVRFTVAAAAVALFGSTVLVAPSAFGAPAATAAPAGTVVNAPTFVPAISELGQVDYTALAAAQSSATAAGGSPASSYRSVDNQLLAHAAGHAASTPAPATTPLVNQNVPGERGFVGLTGPEQAKTVGGTDLEPPDQGLCAGGGYVMEIINNALAVYSPKGAQLLSPIGSPALFKQPATDFFSDPRCYYDAATQRWFVDEFTIVTSAKGVNTSTQYVDVSDTADPTGTYHVYAFDTTDKGTKGCPCFGDYDELGADANGIYITTDQFSITGPAYNGVVVYALSKALLETAAATGIPPSIFGFRVTQDPFGQPYVIAPASTPPGATFAPDTEYFVESNGNASSDDHLMVYALGDTSELATPAPPTLYRVEVATQEYAAPYDAQQKSGPRPLGHQYQAPEGAIQADFDAAMEPTYVNAHLYAQLDTGTAAGTDGVAWFVLTPLLSSGKLTATVAHQGVVAVAGTSLLYPYTALDSSGNGYLLFSLSGRSNYPSPGYVSYSPTGPSGPARVAYPGAAPEDGFTCYAAFVGPSYGGCRWGDYSMGVAMGSKIFMAAEMVPPTARDLLTNWGTYIWSAPPVPTP